MSFPLSALHGFSHLFYIAAAILGIGILIGFHELGHFLFAKLFNVHVPSFSIGFGPSLIKKKIGETDFQLSAIPLGGYVEIAGMAEVAQGEQKEAQRLDSRSFTAKPYWQKLLIMFGGILFNLIFAYFFLILLFGIGMPKSPILYPFNATTTIENVDPEGPAAQQLKAGDQVIAVNGKPVTDKTLDLLNEIRPNAGKPVSLSFVRDSQEHTITITPGGAESKFNGRIGVQFALKDIPVSGLKDALTSGIKTANAMIAQTVHSYKSLFTRRHTGELGGPIAIISQITQGAKQGFKIWLLLLVLISINLAVLNLIPLPILDGGQILFYTIEAAIGRPLPINVRMGIHYATWILLMLLVLYLSFKDIKSLAAPLLGK